MLILIAISLLGAWILSLFGFDALFISGLFQLFGITIGGAGYYILFVIVTIIYTLSINFATGLKRGRKNE